MQRLRRSFGAILAVGLACGLSAHGQATSPLSLQEAISLAQAQHPQMQTAQASEEGARAALTGARAALFPALIVGEDALYSNDPVFAFGSKLRQGRFSSTDFDLNNLNRPAALGNFTSSATANWTAFDDGTARRSVRSARHSLLAAHLMTQYTGEQLAIRITLLYYRVLMAEDQVSVASAALARAKEVDANVSDRVHSGLALDSDGERADLGWHAAQDDLASAKDNVALARMDLFDSLGTAVNDRPLVRPPSEVADAETHTADDHLKNRLDLQALDLQQLAQREMLSSIKASAWPQISTFGHVESDAQHMVKDGSWNWTVGAKVQMTLFDGGARRAREAEALANLHRLDAQQRSTVLAARSDIAAHKTQIEDLRRRLVTAESAIRVQRNALATSQDRYGNGLITISEVLNAESDLSAAEFQRVRTYYQLCIATAELAFTDGSQTTTKAEHP